MTPELAFDLKLAIAALAVAVSAVVWDRWYIRRLWIKTFVAELRREEELRKVTGK